MFTNDLMCEFSARPIGISRRQPMLCWDMKELPAGSAPDGYRVLVATDPSLLSAGHADMWDSGEADGSRTMCVYAGAPLCSMTGYWWCVAGRADGAWTAMSEPAWFECGILDGEDWGGCWIGKPNDSVAVGLFRCAVRLPAAVRRARICLAACGYAQLWINGQRAGDELLSPANADFSRHVYALTYDVGDLLTAGENVIGVRLARGWKEHPAFRLAGYVECEDGTRVPLVSDFEHWVFMMSEILSATIYSGEVVNELYADPSWCLPGEAFAQRYHRAVWNVFSDYLPTVRADNPAQFDEYGFAYYDVLEMPAPGGRIAAQSTEPIRATGEMRPVSLERLADGQIVIDFGQNFAGVVRVHLSGAAGHEVTLRYSEIRRDDGTLDMEYLRVSDPTYALPMQTDRVILAGDDVVYQPEFTYHGFRYVSVTGAQEGFCADDITGIVMNSDLAEGGRFSCTDPLISRLQQNILWTERANLYTIPTDCCQRSERQGWLNDLTARAEATVYNFAMDRFFEKFVQDIADTQDPVSGAIGDTAPFRRGNRPADPVSSSFLILCALLYDHYGNDRPIREHYGELKKWTDFLARNTRDGVLTFTIYGDWASPVDCCEHNGIVSPISAITPGIFVSTGYLYLDQMLMARFAAIVGNREDEERFTAQARQTKQVLLERFFDPATGDMAGGSQGANAFALYLDIVPREMRARTVERLVADIERHDYHLTTGNLMTKYIFEVLSAEGKTDVAYRIITQKTYPSLGYMIEMGATTVWERWEYETGYGMNSHNHPMYGSVSAWFYRYLAGISPLTPGYGTVGIAPCVPTALSAADGVVHTRHGDIRSAFAQADGTVTFTVTIPNGVRGKIRLPAAEGAAVRTFDGTVLWVDEQPQADGVHREGDRICFDAMSGEHVWCVG